MDPQRAPAHVMARAAREFGGVDILVNNAGGAAARHHPPAHVVLRRERRRLARDARVQPAVRGARVPRERSRWMLERGEGAIVNVALQGSRGRARFQGNVDYSAAKAALLNLGKALSEEFAPRGVRVNAVLPRTGASPVVDRRRTEPATPSRRRPV